MPSEAHGGIVSSSSGALALCVPPLSSCAGRAPAFKHTHTMLVGRSRRVTQCIPFSPSLSLTQTRGTREGGLSHRRKDAWSDRERGRGGAEYSTECSEVLQYCKLYCIVYVCRVQYGLQYAEYSGHEQKERERGQSGREGVHRPLSTRSRTPRRAWPHRCRRKPPWRGKRRRSTLSSTARCT